MEINSSRQRRAIAGCASLFGLTVTLMLNEPVGLLVPVAFVTICYGWQRGLMSLISIGLVVAGLFWAEGEMTVHSGGSWAAYTVSAVAIWAVISVYRTISFYDQVYKTVRPTLEDIPGLGWSAYPDGRMRFVNPAATEFIGITPEEMARLMKETDTAWWTPFIHPDDREKSLQLWRHSLKTGEPLLDEQRVRRFDGTYRWFRDTAIASRDQNGEITAWYGSTVDITDQKNAEAALRASEQQLRELIDTVPALIWRARPDGRTAYVNKQLIEWFGISQNPVGDRLGSLLIEAVHPTDRADVEQTFALSFSAKKPFCLRYRHRRADGAYRWTNVRVQPLLDSEGGIVQWFGVCLDINDEIEALDALRRSERETRLIVDTVPSLIWLMSSDGFIYYFNERLVEWSGIEPDGEQDGPRDVRRTYAELIHPDDRLRIAEEFQVAFERGCPLHVKGRLLRKDGQYRWLDSRVEPLRDESGSIVRWYGVSIDIEEEVRAQHALLESERYLQHLIDTVPVGIVLSDDAGLPVYVNRRLQDNGLKAVVPDDSRLIRVKPDMTDLVHPDDREAVTDRWAIARRNGESFAMRYRQRRADGVYRWIEDRSEPFKGDDGAVLQWYGVNLDVDDEVRAQDALRLAGERLARASRAASLSELSVSIAHELNQPLQGIVSNVTAFRNWLKATPPNYDRAERTAEWIMRDADAAAEVVSRIRALFSQTEHRREPVLLKSVIEDVRGSLADKLLNGKIKVVVDVPTSVAETLADKVQLEQVVLNLLRNSIEALEGSGGEERSIVVAASAMEDGFLQVRVSDSGPGMEEPEKVFDAFYTTKADGLGIGLAICRSIIEAHGGQLDAANLVGGGACVCFTLPGSGRVESRLLRTVHQGRAVADTQLLQ